MVAGPTGCGKLTAAQHCVARVGYGLVEIVNESAAATDVISKIRRSGNMLVSSGECKASVIVVTGADGIQSGYSDLLDCSRACGKHVVILVNGAVPFGTAKVAERHRCSWHRPWSWMALLSAFEAVPGSASVTKQERDVLIRHCSDMRQLVTVTEMLARTKQLGYSDSSVLQALMDTPVHQWYNTLAIMKGQPMDTDCHNIGWIGGSYLNGMQSTALEGAASFAGNLVVADMLQQSGGCEFGDDYSALVLQSSMPLVSHVSGIQIEKIKLDMPRPNKRARYSFALNPDM